MIKITVDTHTHTNVSTHAFSTLEENIATETHRRKLITDIASLEKKVRSEKQLNRQIQLNEELKRMRKELEQIS